MANECILCGSSPTTKAHVFASKLRAVIPKEMQSFTRFQSEDSGSRSVIETRRHGRGSADWQPKVLCAGCNGEWMSPIEERAAPLLVELAYGAAVELDAQRLRDLAEWALAAAIVRAETVDEGESFDRDLAVRFRNESLVGLPVSVWLVNIRPDPHGPAWLRTRRRQSRWSELSHDYFRPAGNGATGEGCLFQLRGVAVIVATADVAEHVGRRLRHISSAVLHAWPTPAESASWPPRAEAPLSVVQALFARPSMVDEGFYDLSDAPRLAARGPHTRIIARDAPPGSDETPLA